jgi:Holliday junction DNA helicase RuvA
MIGKLRGKVDEIHEDSVILDVNGVGYHVFCSARTLATLKPGEAATLIIEMHVREDHMHLYGFPDSVEREWFRLLTSVQRVGAKMGLTLMGAYGPEQLAYAILAKDTAAFSRISGVGAKLAERIVTELKDKVAKVPVSGLGTGDSGLEKKKKSLTPNTQSLTEDAISALVNLGYSRSEAYGAAIRANQNGASGLDQLIKLSLKELVRG